MSDDAKVLWDAIVDKGIPICARCRFWAQGGRRRRREARLNVAGRCRRNRPSYDNDVVVYGSEWCGEFEQGVPPDERLHALQLQINGRRDDATDD